MTEKIVQTAGRDALGTFAPEFAHFNDDILFGENWNNEDIDLKTRCIITVVSLMSQGVTDSSLKYHDVGVKRCQESWCNEEGDGSYHYTYCFLLWLASFGGCV